MHLGKWESETMFKKRKTEILKNFDSSKIILGPSSANSFGQESLGLGQVRGNGILILTNNELFFGMYLPKKDFNIPLNAIAKIDIVKSHLKKTKSRKLLKVHFTNMNGQPDSIAWLINDLDTWVYTLNNKI